ncbi:MAG TPA: DUF4242 domain-containing protein [Flavitalea sp.]|nr:DUF4242 domain-containing protein [Flavitalea sp.]
MKKANLFTLLLSMMLLIGYISVGQTATVTDNAKNKTNTEMKTFLIEREIPDAGKLTGEQLKSISQKSCSVLKEMGPRIQWINSYVTGNKIYCIYKAESEEQIREHAQKGGFPANKIIEVASVISPATAN